MAPSYKGYYASLSKRTTEFESPWGRQEFYGRMAEWTIALALKARESKGSVGSNPTFSATESLPMLLSKSGSRKWMSPCRQRQPARGPQENAQFVGLNAPKAECA
jgi:hypothetical protein